MGLVEVELGSTSGLYNTFFFLRCSCFFLVYDDWNHLDLSENMGVPNCCGNFNIENDDEPLEFRKTPLCLKPRGAFWDGYRKAAKIGVRCSIISYHLSLSYLWLIDVCTIISSGTAHILNPPALVGVMTWRKKGAAFRVPALEYGGGQALKALGSGDLWSVIGKPPKSQGLSFSQQAPTVLPGSPGVSAAWLFHALPGRTKPAIFDPPGTLWHLQGLGWFQME